MKIVMISDVHEQWHDLKIPACDLLISAGDYSYRGEPHVVHAFHKWLNEQPAKHIISVQGNHELGVEKDFYAAKALVPQRINFLTLGRVEVNGIKIWCSSATPEFGGWAFGLPRGHSLTQHWAKIPDDTQILITHGPARGILDQALLGRWTKRLNDPRAPLGCDSLRKRIDDLPKLKLHVFGHIHASSGVKILGKVTFINAAICDESYKPTNPIREFVFNGAQ